MSHIEYPLVAMIDLEAFRYNINFIRNKFPKTKIILPVKANAYGHGDVLISKEAERSGIEYLAVARLDEGMNLRYNKVKIPILNFGVEFDYNIDLAIKNKIELSVSCIEHIKEIEARAKKLKVKSHIHLKVDTGMSRLGCEYATAVNLAEYIELSDFLMLKSIYTHFAKSDEDSSFNSIQIKLFLDLINNLKTKSINPEFFHFYNSGAILNQPKFENACAIRPGIMSYGYSPFNNKYKNLLKPVMTLKSRVVNIKKVKKGTGISYGHIFRTKKDSIIATIPLGYGDGFHRVLSNKFKVTINNQNYSQIGRISMDLTVVKIDEKVRLKDEVIIFGDKKNCANDADDLAKLSNTISYEITTSLTNRVKRLPINIIK